MLNFTPRTSAALLVRAQTNLDQRRIAASIRRDDNAVHRAADKGYPLFRVAVAYAFASGKKAIDKSALKEATTIRAAAAAVSGAPDAVAEAFKKAILSPMETTLALGGNAGVGRLRSKVTNLAARRALATPLKFSFDSKNPEATKWAAAHAAELVKDITDTTRQDIADAIIRAVDGDGISEAYDDILDAVGDDSRAELIARTESMTAANEGQRQGWDQAVDAGLLPEDAKRVWIATSGCCDDCDDLDGEETTLDGEYPNDGGDGPPLHPNCRCTEGISGT